MRTVLITGSSKGIGKETALYFARKGWNVVATMRNPKERKTDLSSVSGITVVHLDVLDRSSIKKAVKYTQKEFKRIDVIVNNAGYPIFGPFEETTKEQVDKQFNTNVMGLMDVTREVLPLMKKQKSGVIVNVASVGGRIGFPLYGVYNSTKWAVEGFSEALQYELRQFNIKVKVIEPGKIQTEFYGSSQEIGKRKLKEYNKLIKKVEKGINGYGGSQPSVVAETIYKAATDGNWRLRYRVGSTSGLTLTLRKLLPESVFLWGMRMALSR